MPTYDYACDTCKKKYELRESFSAESTHLCKKCGKGTAKRQLSAPAIVFKGSGFYVTDSSKSSSSTLPSDKADDNGNGTGKSKNKSETKKETSSDSGAGAATASADD